MVFYWRYLKYLILYLPYFTTVYIFIVIIIINSDDVNNFLFYKVIELSR